MIKIKKNTTRDVALTLQEKTTISNPVYIFSFTHELTKQVVNFTATDTGAYPERVNVFEITESSTPDEANGIVTLNKGFHTYIIYEAESESPQELDPDNYSPSLSIVERGKVYVWEVEEELPTFTDEAQGEIKTFQG